MAVPPVLVIATEPVVVNPEMLWVVMIPEMVMDEAFAVKVPELLKFPPNDNARLFVPSVFKVAPVLIVNGTEELNTLFVFKVMIPVLAMITPPVAAKGVIHSAPTV